MVGRSFILMFPCSIRLQVGSMVEDGMLTSVHELVISTATVDMESKLEELMHVIPFDLEGRLVKRVALDGGS